MGDTIDTKKIDELVESAANFEMDAAMWKKQWQILSEQNTEMRSTLNKCLSHRIHIDLKYKIKELMQRPAAHYVEITRLKDVVVQEAILHQHADDLCTWNAAMDKWICPLKNALAALKKAHKL